ncbi:MAG: PIG-L family deacetylase [Nitrospinae bacterium]|nr:PIG-L family deacetylase [Nitrospinota bacterium]
MGILAIGAHPDDIEIGCGGTLHKFAAEGHGIYLMVMTLGDKGGDTAKRKAEQMKSAEILGAADVFFQGYEDTNLPMDKGTVDSIERVIHKILPQYIFVNYKEDTHQDHRALAKATISATRNIRNVLFYEVPTTHDFTPNVFVDITSVMERKVESLEAHSSQIMKTNVEGSSIMDIALSAARFRGVQGRVKFAEGFVSQRLFLNI